MHNSDGVWLRLTGDSAHHFCDKLTSNNKWRPTEAWVLQYNNHLKKTLLYSLPALPANRREVLGGEEKTLVPSEMASSYRVVHCGASGHHIRSEPSLRSAVLGMMNKNSIVTGELLAFNMDGTWLKLDSSSCVKFNVCQNEAWALVESKEQKVYIAAMDVNVLALDSDFFWTGDINYEDEPSMARGCGDGSASDELEPALPKKDHSGSVAKSNCSGLDNIKRKHSSGSSASDRTDLPQELQGVSVRELVKAIGEFRGSSIAKEVSPTATPRRIRRAETIPTPPKSEFSPAPPNSVVSSSLSTSGNTLTIVTRCDEDDRPSEHGIRKSESSSYNSGGPVPSSAIGVIVEGYSTTSDAASLAQVSSLAQDMSQSNASVLSDLPESSPNSPKEMKVIQTSLDSVHKSSLDSAKLSKETVDKDRCQRDRLNSPSVSKKYPHITTNNSWAQNGTFSSSEAKVGSFIPSQVKMGSFDQSDGKVGGGFIGPDAKSKLAFSPSVAECMRAVFAAFLWHEGIVHDAMACASFLKFHPDLSKSTVFLHQNSDRLPKKTESVKLTKEQKKRQRHSVEVSACHYLNVKPQNTDDFFKQPINANATNNLNENVVPEWDESCPEMGRYFAASIPGGTNAPPHGKLATL